jgi:hypothetical protein
VRSMHRLLASRTIGHRLVRPVFGRPVVRADEDSVYVFDRNVKRLQKDRAARSSPDDAEFLRDQIAETLTERLHVCFASNKWLHFTRGFFALTWQGRMFLENSPPRLISVATLATFCVGFRIVETSDFWLSAIFQVGIKCSISNTRVRSLVLGIRGNAGTASKSRNTSTCASCRVR